MPYLLIIGLQVACIVHLMRRGGNPMWVTALIFLPVVSAIAYFFVEILPGLGQNRHVRTARARAVATLDPERELNGPECIRCGACKATCPTTAISSGWELRAREALTSAPAQ